MSDDLRCHKCGYSAEDQAIHRDHHLCDGTIPTTMPSNEEILEQRLAAVIAELRRGSAELRKYVEGNGFEWNENETTVFNVTTAIGLLGGTVEELRKHLAAAEARCERLRELLKDESWRMGRGDEPYDWNDADIDAALGEKA